MVSILLTLGFKIIDTPINMNIVETIKNGKFKYSPSFVNIENNKTPNPNSPIPVTINTTSPPFKIN